ncbi:MAG: cell wall hydrolase [Bacillota bacterium]
MKNKFIQITLTIIIMLFTISFLAKATPDFKLIYVIQEGDTLSEIANNYNISADKLREVNDIKKNQFIKSGEELIIPETNNNNDNNKRKLFSDELDSEKEAFSFGKDSTYSVRVNDNKENIKVDIPPSQLITYHVSLGDTLYELARDFNTSTGVIMALNDLENSIIRAGDQLKVPINNLTQREVLSKTITDKELEFLARVIFGEARGEPYIGQVAVGAVVINRVVSNYFPDDFRSVIYQSGQFSAVADGQINLTPTKTAYRAAREALNGKDPTRGALYYYNPRIAKNKKWFDTREPLVTIGEHVFAK